MAIPNFYVQSPEQQILLNKAMQNYSQTGSYISPSGLNRNNDTMMPLPPQYVQENRYITREIPEMGPPSQEDIIEMFRDVKRNPTNYSQEDINMVKELYQQMFGKSLFGAEDTNVVNTLGNAAWELADTAAFGLLPDKIAENMGLRELNAADDLAKLAGMVGAFFINPISPATTGTRVAGKILPKAANFFKGAEGATTKVPKFLQGIMGGKTEVAGNMVSNFLSNPNVARRVGSAIGGGFNFETGINPMGLVLGTMFPGKLPADDVAAAAPTISKAPTEPFVPRALLPSGSYTIKNPNVGMGLGDELGGIINSGNNAARANFYRRTGGNSPVDDFLRGYAEKGMIADNFGYKELAKRFNITEAEAIEALKRMGKVQQSPGNIIEKAIENSKGVQMQSAVTTPKTRTEITVAINDELQVAKANLSQIAETNPEAARIIAELDALWSTPIGQNKIIETALKNMQGISPEFGSRFDDIWGVSSSLGRR